MADNILQEVANKAVALYGEIGDVDQTVERMMEWLEAHPEDRDAVIRAMIYATVAALGQVFKPVTFGHN